MPFDGIELSPITKTLMKGRKRIEAGWCQGAFRMGGAVCAVGAVSEDPDDPVVSTALKVLESAFGSAVTDIPEWNDSPDRTKEEVLALYDRAIALSLR